MADYDLFVLNAEGEIIRSTRIVSDSDVEVVAIAKKQAVGGDPGGLGRGP
jgi:hypothetical protein